MDGKKYWTLTPVNLTMYPIWVPAMDVALLREEEEGEGDERDDDPSLVVPLPDETALVDRLLAHSNLYVRTTFIAANGRHFIGLIKSTGGAGVEQTAPAITTDEGQVGFYSGLVRPSPVEVDVSYRRLGLNADELFPLSYRPDVSIPDGSPGGVLYGFYYLETNDGVVELRHLD